MIIRLSFILFFTVFLFGMGDTPNSEELKSSKSSIVQIRVDGMTCSMCAQSIEKKLKENNTVQSITVDFETKVIEVTYNEKKPLSDQQINDAVYYAGYDLVSIKRL